MKFIKTIKFDTLDNFSDIVDYGNELKFIDIFEN